MTLERVAEMQSDWFIREVKRCRDIGMPLGCCDEWPECSHVLAWVEEREVGVVERQERARRHCLDPEVCNWPNGRCVEPSRCKAPHVENRAQEHGQTFVEYAVALAIIAILVACVLLLAMNT